MTDTTDTYTRVPVSADAIDIARDAKRDGETWGDYLLRCADADDRVVTVADLPDAIQSRPDVQAAVIEGLRAALEGDA